MWHADVYSNLKKTLQPYWGHGGGTLRQKRSGLLRLAFLCSMHRKNGYFLNLYCNNLTKFSRIANVLTSKLKCSSERPQKKTQECGGKPF